MMYAPANQRFGFIGLETGVRPRHIWVLLFAAYVTIGLINFEAFATPFVLSTAVGIPLGEQGAVVGRLNVYTEIILLMIFTPLGVLSDRIGRRSVYAVGFLCLALSYALFPYASSEAELALIRVIYAIGIGGVAGMITALLGDYAIASDRGKLTAMVGVLNGLGVVSGAIFLAPLPRVFSDAGHSQFESGQLTLWIVAGLCVMSSLIVAVGLRKGTPIAGENRPAVGELFRSGFDAAWKNPRIAVAYASAFVSRGDMVMVSTFLVLWGKVTAVNNGMDTAAAIDAARVPFIISQSAALMWAIVAMFLLDRMQRVTGLVICMGMAAVGYLFLVFVDDPLDPANIPFFILLGIGQISAFLGSMTLIGKEAPVAERGSVMGVYNVAGALGILITSGLGGWMFDSISPRAPFILLGLMNLAVMIAAIFVRIYAPVTRPPPAVNR